MLDLKRRQLITLLSGAAAAAWPLAARAQQPERMRRIGILMNFTSDDPVSQDRLAAFVQGLQELGWTVGRNLQIDYRWGAGNVERYRTFAAELEPHADIGPVEIPQCASLPPYLWRVILFASI